ELPFQPVPDRGAPIDVPVLTEPPPRFPCIGFGKRIAPDAKGGEWHSAGVKQPGDVVIWCDEQAGWIAERLVMQKQLRVDVPMWGNDGQVTHGLVQSSRNCPHPRLRWQQSI